MAAGLRAAIVGDIERSPVWDGRQLILLAPPSWDLLVQSGWTAGPDGVREPSPHHSNGIDVPMKSQVWLGCVGIDRLCHHASLLSRKLQNMAQRPKPPRPRAGSSHAGASPPRRCARSCWLALPPPPGSAAAGAVRSPTDRHGRLRAQQISAGAVDQKPAPILVAALGYPAQAMFAAGGSLPWHQAQPGRELAPTAEAARFYHGGGEGCGDDRADARNARQALADGVALVPGHELLLDRRNRRLQLLNLCRQHL